MAVMKMVALTLVGPKAEMETVARQMLTTSTFQPIALDSLVNDRNVRAKMLTSTDNPYDELLSKLSAVWKIAGEKPPQPETANLTADFTLTEARFRIERITQKLDLWKKLRESLSETGFEPSAVLKSEFLSTHFGRMSSENYARLLDNDKFAFVANKMMEHDGNVWLLLLAPTHKEEEVKQLLDSLNFAEYSSLYSVKSDNEVEEEELLALLTSQIEKHTTSIDGLAHSARELLESKRQKIEQLYAQTYTMQRIYDLCKERGELDGVFTISGWLPQEKLETVRELINKEAPNTSVIAEQIKDISVPVPVMLKNSKLFAPFQDIVAMYSLPSYDESDPSAIVALTFTLFFGFMFGDIGHGLIIFLAALFAQKKNIVSASLAFVMKCAAVSSMIFGLLYGSIFGQEGIIHPLWILPMENTGTLIAVAIAIGFGVISLGMLLNIVKQFKAKNFVGMLFDGQCMAGLALYWSLTAIMMLRATGNSASPALRILGIGTGVIALLMMFKGVLARVIFKEKEAESTMMCAFGIAETLLSFLSNTASFVRLAAFALNHVGLSMAVITLAEMMKNLPGGIVFKGLMLIAGNLLVAGLEGLIVFIQTLRLEYYEFFGKFFKGGGQKFKPVKLEQG